MSSEGEKFMNNETKLNHWHRIPLQKLTVPYLFKNLPDLKGFDSNPPLVPIQSQMNPIPNLPPYLY